MKRVVLVLAFATLANVALAWGPAGHKIVAAIAFRQLTPQQQKRINEILESHPCFKDDFTDRMPDEVEEKEWNFHQAAVWPDIARKTENDRPNWHFINLPYFPTDEDRQALEGHLHLNTSFNSMNDHLDKMNCVQAMRYALRVVNDHDSSKADKAKYLSWIFHLVGDSHQPLHSTALCMDELFEEGDHGGNWIPTVQKRDLHALWDGFPGNQNIKFRVVQQRAIKLSNDRDLKRAGEKAIQDLNVVTWIKESRALAERYAYTTEVIEHLDGITNRKDIPKLDLSEEYLTDGGEVCDKRVVEAGFRLAAILKQIAGE